MAYDFEREELKKWVTDRLHESGQFVEVSPDKKFSNNTVAASDLDAANLFFNRHVYARMNSEYACPTQPLDFIVICNTAPMPKEKLEAKLRAFSIANIATLPILYKNDVFFKWGKAATTKREVRQGTAAERRCMIDLTLMERTLAGTWTGGNPAGGAVTYFTPSRKEQPEPAEKGTLEVVRFEEGAQGVYEHIRDRNFPARRDLVKTYTSKIVRTLEAFTMYPVRKGPLLLARAEPPIIASLRRAEAFQSEDPERVAIMLSDMPTDQLTIVARDLGRNFLGGFATYLPAEQKN